MGISIWYFNLLRFDLTCFINPPQKRNRFFSLRIGRQGHKTGASEKHRSCVSHGSLKTPLVYRHWIKHPHQWWLDVTTPLGHKLMIKMFCTYNVCMYNNFVVVHTYNVQQTKIYFPAKTFCFQEAFLLDWIWLYDMQSCNTLFYCFAVWRLWICTQAYT